MENLLEQWQKFPGILNLDNLRVWYIDTEKLIIETENKNKALRDLLIKAYPKIWHHVLFDKGEHKEEEGCDYCELRREIRKLIGFTNYSEVSR